MAVSADFADFCCELLSSVGHLRARRMFGGWGLSLDGLTIAIVADLGTGDKLWLKADAVTRGQFEAAACERFSYAMRQGEQTVARGLNYYCPPAEAMDAPHAMAPWARLALQSALSARAVADAKALARKKPTTATGQAAARAPVARKAPRTTPRPKKPQG